MMSEEEFNKLQKDIDDRIKEKFYRYAHIDPSREVTRNDIEKNWYGAFNKIKAEEGVSTERMLRVLTGDPKYWGPEEDYSSAYLEFGAY